MIVKIKNLKLQTIVGINDWERKEKQDVIINIEAEFDENPALETDNIEDSVNYRTMTKKIINLVESSSFQLLEKLASEVLKIVMEDKKVLSTKVEVDKPGALRFSESVSVECSAMREKEFVCLARKNS